MHTLLVFSVVYGATVLIAGSVIVVSTKRNRVPLILFVVLLPMFIVVSVGATFIDLVRGKARKKMSEVATHAPEYQAAAEAVEIKRVQMFGGSARSTKIKHALRERYCIHLARSADSLTHWFGPRKAAA